MSQTLLEKLQLKDERNLLIQGLPSSIEKQFVKLAFAKNLTPLLKSRRIDFARTPLFTGLIPDAVASFVFSRARNGQARR